MQDNYYKKYIKYKTKYLKIKSQTGKKNNCEKEFESLPNANVEFYDRMKIIFSFIPTTYSKDEESDDTPTIKYNKENVKHFKKYFNTQKWKENLYYLFSSLRPYLLPYYTPEMYYLTDITTKVTNADSSIKIIIIGTIRKYSYDEVKKKSKETYATNVSWSDIIDEKMKFCNFYYLVADGFFKITNQGELDILGLGLMHWGYHTNMKAEIIN